MNVIRRLLVSTFLLTLAGCGGSFVPRTLSDSQAGVGLHGIARGGQSPVAGAAVYLLAASNAGYGTPSVSLLTGVPVDVSGRGYVTTDGGGGFNITGDYTCPSASSQVYLVATGGNPGLPGNVSNPALAEIAALGPCGDLSASTFITVNELSTVAAITALAPFTSAAGFAVATSTTNSIGLSNAFSTAIALVNPATGTANAVTPGGLGTIPVAEINTLADVLASCVNSNGSGVNCTTLFTATTPPGGTAPTDTLQAMLNIARYPARNVAALYGLVAAAAPFQPTLSAGFNDFTLTYDGIPNDWSVAIAYKIPTWTAPNFLAIDSQSNIWVANGGNQTATEMTALGKVTHIVTTTTQSQLSANNYNHVLAVDLDDNLWVDNNSYGASKISPAGVLLSYPNANWGYTPGPGTNAANLGGNYPTGFWVAGYGGVAIDSSNNAWMGSAASANSALVRTDNDGVGLNFYQGGGLINPTSIAIDTTGNVWMANEGGACCSPNSLVKFSSSGAVLSGAAGFPVGNTPIALAIDHSGNVWVANQGDNTLSAVTQTGVPLPGSPFVGGGLYFPSDVAIDGAGNVWVSNFNSIRAGLSKFSNNGTALSPARGFYVGSHSELGSVAIDASGNVWTSNWGYQSINENVGLGAPTTNPLALAVKLKQLGVQP